MDPSPAHISKEAKKSSISPQPEWPAIVLLRSSWPLVIVGLYCALSLFSWIVIVYLAFYPITDRNLRYRSRTGFLYMSSDEIDDFYTSNERWIQTIRVLLSFAAVLSIPVASAVCSRGAAVYAQRRVSSPILSLRKVMMLADKSWLNPFTYARALSFPGWRRYGSPFLIAAILVHVLAFLVAPLQQIFLGSATIKRAAAHDSIRYIFDIPGQFNDHVPKFHTNHTVVLETRDLLQRANILQPQPHLWAGDESCISAPYDEKCIPNAATFTNLSSLQDPFLAQLPRGFSTGMMRQYLPRINSSSTIVFADFPEDCESMPGWLYFHHKYSRLPNVPYYLDDAQWEVMVCMPRNVTQPLWKPTRARQDFSEELYVKGIFLPREMQRIEYTRKITVDTTAGYFELPNYFNEQKPGPLLPRLPECGESCFEQFPDEYEEQYDYPNPHLDAAIGPLQSIALAVFGPDSFLTTWRQKAALYSARENVVSPYAVVCIGLSPFGTLLVSPDGNIDAHYDPEYEALIDKPVNGDQEPCGFTIDDTPNSAVQRFLINFQAINTERLENAFNAASILANLAWMLHGSRRHRDDRASVEVYYDMGKDTQIPTISTAGIIAISVVLGTYLASLFAFAIYAARTPRWTDQLDAFAMLRIGSALASDLSLLASRNPDFVQVLDDLPGIMGDALPEHEAPGKLWPGGETPLRARREYYSYPFKLKKTSGRTMTE